MSLPVAPENPDLPPSAVKAAQRFLKTTQTLSDKSYWPVRMFVTSNLFLWHLEAFKLDEDPVPLFVDQFNRASEFLLAAKESNICLDLFPAVDIGQLSEDQFEASVSGLFSDIWVGLTDDVYFDETYEFTKERLTKSGVDPEELFRGKVVVDAGCGSGKFSAAIARLGAKKVIGLDIGEKGLAFARSQAKKKSFDDRLDYRYGSLLDIPLDDSSVDMVWSNGVIHHTLGYEECIQEFSRILKPGGDLFLYVNGRFGLFELLQDTLRKSNANLPKPLYQHFLSQMNINTGRIYWMMDCLFAPYEWKSKQKLLELLTKHGFGDFVQLKRGVQTDQIEQVSTGLPFSEVKYGEAQLKFLAKKTTV
jgi:ubiquinone/menaquinone biosynthesis C-methylase UbiE